jgi:hypothetical protein
VYTITINPVDTSAENAILFDPAVAEWTAVPTDAIAL